MPSITTFLTYNDQAEEAVNLYVSLFPNSRVVRVVRCGEQGPGPVGSVLVVNFELLGQPYVALNGGPSFSFSEGVSLSVACETQEEIDRYWDALAEGGEVQACGWLKDRFGLSWQINPTCLMEMLRDLESEAGKRAMAAMMSMVKFDIAALQRAYDGA
ncbi:MAG: VOC family protein [Fimbriimonadaceae bacterium]|nr:VOC family protein [Fimbriimonadaceae bacterium]